MDWTAEELIRVIQKERPTENVMELAVQIHGPFTWHDQELSVSRTPPEESDCPRLWQLEVEFDVTAETVQMPIPPARPVADTMRGVDIEWDCDYPFELEIRGLTRPLMESECRDHMEVAIKVHGRVTELPEIRVLVHCEGQKLELSAGTWKQLRQRLNDIA
jgi:hypothetical protein